MGEDGRLRAKGDANEVAVRGERGAQIGFCDGGGELSDVESTTRVGGNRDGRGRDRLRGSRG